MQVTADGPNNEEFEFIELFCWNFISARLSHLHLVPVHGAIELVPYCMEQQQEEECKQI